MSRKNVGPTAPWFGQLEFRRKPGVIIGPARAVLTAIAIIYASRVLLTIVFAVLVAVAGAQSGQTMMGFVRALAGSWL